jgi:hypothetical protein
MESRRSTKKWRLLGKNIGIKTLPERRSAQEIGLERKVYLNSNL